jgi:hypothetical protein
VKFCEVYTLFHAFRAVRVIIRRVLHSTRSCHFGNVDIAEQNLDGLREGKDSFFLVEISVERARLFSVDCDLFKRTAADTGDVSFRLVMAHIGSSE